MDHSFLLPPYAMLSTVKTQHLDPIQIHRTRRIQLAICATLGSWELERAALGNPLFFRATHTASGVAVGHRRRMGLVDAPRRRVHLVHVGLRQPGRAEAVQQQREAKVGRTHLPRVFFCPEAEHFGGGRLEIQITIR